MWHLNWIPSRLTPLATLIQDDVRWSVALAYNGAQWKLIGTDTIVDKYGYSSLLNFSCNYSPKETTQSTFTQPRTIRHEPRPRQPTRAKRSALWATISNLTERVIAAVGNAFTMSTSGTDRKSATLPYMPFFWFISDIQLDWSSGGKKSWNFDQLAQFGENCSTNTDGLGFSVLIFYGFAPKTTLYRKKPLNETTPGPEIERLLGLDRPLPCCVGSFTTHFA